MNEQGAMIKVFETAIGMEDRGYDFYIKASRASKNEFGRRVFKELAEDERRHKDAIKGYCAAIAETRATPALCAVADPHEDVKERMLFGKDIAALLKGVKADADEMKAYEIGMKMENDSYAFYKNALESTQDAHAKELYRFLLGEEKAHFEIISSTYEYLKDPAAYLLREERPIVEG